MLRLMCGAVILLGAARAQADEPADAPGRSEGQVVEEASRALQAGDSQKVIELLNSPELRRAAPCQLGRALTPMAKSPAQKARALLYLERCRAHDEGNRADESLREQVLAMRKELQSAKLAQVSLALRPREATAKLDAHYVGDSLEAEDELWLPIGEYRLEVVAPGHEGGVYAVRVSSRDRMLVPISLPAATPIGERSVDLGEEPGDELGQVSTTTDPRPKKFKTLLAKRYQGADPAHAPSDEPTQSSAASMAWPALAGGGALAALGLGVGLQVKEHPSGAILSYGAGAGLAGLALYLLLHERPVPDEGTRIQADEELITLSYAGHF